jgi:hypothetical protein
MKFKTFSNFSLGFSIFCLALLCLVGISSTSVKAQSPSFTIKKDVCDAINPTTNACVQGNNRELDGQSVTFTIAYQSDPGQVVNSFPVVINNGSGQGSPTSGLGSGSNRFPFGVELRVCEIPVDGFTVTPQPEGSTGGQFRAEGNCIIFTTAPGNQQLQFANVRALVPTAAPVKVSGRLLNLNGRAVSKARLVLTDSNGVTRMVTTNSFGYYKFEDLEAGETYIIGGFHKSYTIAPQVISLVEDLTEQTLFAEAKSLR